MFMSIVLKKKQRNKTNLIGMFFQEKKAEQLFKILIKDHYSSSSFSTNKRSSSCGRCLAPRIDFKP